MVKRSTLLILFILLTLGFGRSALAQERKATISYFEGEVNILKAGKTNWIPAELKMDLRPGDRIRALLASLCEIVLEDGSSITVEENTTIDIKKLILAEETKESSFKLWIGKIKVRVKRLMERSFLEVETPTGLVGARGTTWTMGHDKTTGITFAAVEEGEVYLRGIKQPKEEEIILRAGEYVEISPDGTSALPAEKPIPTIQDVIIEGKISGEDVKIVARILDKIPLMNVSLFYKVSGIKSYSSVNMVLTEESVYEGIIPGVEVESPGIDFYIEAENELKAIGQYGTQDSPQKVEIEEKKVIAPPEIRNVIDLPKPRIVSWELSPQPDYGWHNEFPNLNLNIKANISEPLFEIPLIITINETEMARLWGGPGYTHTITKVDLLDQGRNDLKVSANFEDGEAASITIPAYFDDIDPVITDPAIDFEGRRLTVKVFGESGEKASGVRTIKANGIRMSTLIQDEEYEIVGIDLSAGYIEVEAWDKTGIAGNKGTLSIDIADFDLSPPVIQPQRCSFIYNRNEWQLQVEVEVTDEGSGVKQVTANGVIMTRSGDMYNVTLGGQSYEEGETIEIVAKDNVGHTSRMDLSSPPPPPPPEP
ncbi:FecR family protein [bacterium]|nr:FecR family protein [bacterium]